MQRNYLFGCHTMEYKGEQGPHLVAGMNEETGHLKHPRESKIKMTINLTCT
jgi:hypothetical protein